MLIRDKLVTKKKTFLLSSWSWGSLYGGGGANQGQAGAGAGARDPHVTHMDMLKLLHLGTVVHSYDFTE